MFTWQSKMFAALALLGLTSALFAQVPAIGGDAAAAGAAPAATTGATGATGAAPQNLWSFLCCTPDQIQACKNKFCACPLGQMLTSMAMPASAFTGGLLPPLCPSPNDPNAADLKKSPDSAEGAAAKIKQQEAQAKARRAAVRYLGTVDCQRFPEAETALLNALQADTNECVRIEAALAFAKGCCCSKKVIEALALSASGRNPKNDPPETSERVKWAAGLALEHCLAKWHDYSTPQRRERPTVPLPPEVPRPEPPIAEGPGVEGAPAAPAMPPVPISDGLPPPRKLPEMSEANTTSRGEADPVIEEARRVVALRKGLNKGPPMAANEGPLRPVAAVNVAESVALLQAPPAQPIVPVAATQPAPAVAAPRRPSNMLPPTGQRDLWTVFKMSLRSER